MALRPGKVAIVGVAESDALGHVPEKSSLQHHAEAAFNALEDAGLTKQDVDGLFTARFSPLSVAEYLGIVPDFSDGTWIGGGSFETHVRHASAAIQAGYCEVALVTHGQAGRSARSPGWRDELGLFHGNVLDSPDPNQPATQYEIPYGIVGAPAGYALSCTRYMHLYEEDRTRRALADIAMATRAWAELNPKAWMYGRPMRLEDYHQSPWVVWPFHRADCCLVTDGGGAVILTSEERARDLKKEPVFVLGSAESHDHGIISQMPELTSMVAEKTGQKAMAEAGITHRDVDHAMLYDAFTYSVLLSLESLGFCAPGEGADFVRETGIGPLGTLPINTNGGGLSYTHTGMHGIFLLIEATRQLRGECDERQVPDCRRSLVNGIGGILSSCSTVVLGTD